MSIAEKKLRQQIAKALYVGKRTRASIPGLPVWDWEPAWLQDEYLQQADDLLDIFSATRAAALEEAAGIAESFGMVSKRNLEPYWEGWDDSTDRVSQAIRAVAGAS